MDLTLLKLFYELLHSLIPLVSGADAGHAAQLHEAVDAHQALTIGVPVTGPEPAPAGAGDGQTPKES
jgi:hypothetical protein